MYRVSSGYRKAGSMNVLYDLYFGGKQVLRSQLLDDVCNYVEKNIRRDETYCESHMRVPYSRERFIHMQRSVRHWDRTGELLPVPHGLR